MDVCAIGRFHRSVSRFHPDPFGVPDGGLARFLREDLRAKVFLVSIGVFEDRWAIRACPSVTAEELFNLRVCMRIIVDHVVCLVRPSPIFLLTEQTLQYYAARIRQNELRSAFSRFNTPSESAWMFYLILVLLHVIGFDGDDGPVEHGFGPMQMALAETDFLLRKSSETFHIRQTLDTEGYLDYEEYDPRRTVEMYFKDRREPSSFSRIRSGPPPEILFETPQRTEYWTETERVVEAAVIALSRIEGPVEVETVDGGTVIGVSKKSVAAIIGDMVHPRSVASNSSDRPQGIRSYSPTSRQLVRSFSPSRTSAEVSLEEWSPFLIIAGPSPV